MANKIPIKITAGIHSQKTKTTNPANNTKIWNKIPAKIKNNLIIAPSNLEKKLDTNVFMNSLNSTILGYFQVYFLQGEKSDFNKVIIEK